jgi:hypothetical protein
MGTRRGKPALLGAVVIVVMCLAACGSAVGPGSGSSATAGPAVPPQLVTPKSVGGTPGKGPRIISSPARLPGGKISSQKVVLNDRTVVITSVTRQPGTNQGSILITLNLVVRNTSEKAIRNRSTFFQLTGAEGDTFGPQTNSSDDFYRTIDAHASRSGTIEFEIPAAAASGLTLLYRPENATETVLTPLKAG